MLEHAIEHGRGGVYLRLQYRKLRSEPGPLRYSSDGLRLPRLNGGSVVGQRSHCWPPLPSAGSLRTPLCSGEDFLFRFAEVLSKIFPRYLSVST
jgi:hypothetical protein